VRLFIWYFSCLLIFLPFVQSPRNRNALVTILIIVISFNGAVFIYFRLLLLLLFCRTINSFFAAAPSHVHTDRCTIVIEKKESERENVLGGEGSGAGIGNIKKNSGFTRAHRNILMLYIYIYIYIYIKHVCGVLVSKIIITQLPVAFALYILIGYLQCSLLPYKVCFVDTPVIGSRVVYECVYVCVCV
jgi:hypothetical protein